MNNKKIIAGLIIVSLIVVSICSAGCIFDKHNPEDKINADYMKKGYYYFEDDEKNSFYETLHTGDTTQFSNGFTPNDWIDYVQKEIEYREENGEHFQTAEETVFLGYADCEDKSILMARGLNDMGFHTCVLILEEHVTAGISKSEVDDGKLGIKRLVYKHHLPWKDGIYYTDENGIKWYVLETTCEANIGAFDEQLNVEKIYYV